MPVFRKSGVTVLFVHIPKAGGTFLRRALERDGWRCDYSDDGNFRDPYSLNFYRRSSPQHMDREQLEAVFRLERFDMVFTVCRNPMSRLLSEWKYRNRQNPRRPSVEEWFTTTLNLHRSDASVLDNHFRPQSDFLVQNCRVFKLEEGPERAIDMVNGLSPRHGAGAEAVSKKNVPTWLSVGRYVRNAVSLRKLEQPDLNNLRPTETGPDIEISKRLREKAFEFYATDYQQFGYSH